MKLEGCYFDKPVIHVAFDCPGQTNPIPCRKYYDFDHFRPIVELGCSTLAEDMASLLDAVAEAAKDPTLRQDGRRRVVDRYFGVARGSAGATWVGESSRLVEAG